MENNDKESIKKIIKNYVENNDYNVFDLSKTFGLPFDEIFTLIGFHKTVIDKKETKIKAYDNEGRLVYHANRTGFWESWDYHNGNYFIYKNSYGAEVDQMRGGGYLN